MLFLMIAFILAFLLPEAKAEDAAEKTLAIVVGVPGFGNYPTLGNGAYATEANPVVKARGVAEALKDRVDKVVIYDTGDSTRKASVEASMNALAYEGFDHVTLVWFGWSATAVTKRERNADGNRRTRDEVPRLFASDLDLEFETGGLAESSFTLDELERLLMRIAPRQTVVLDVNRSAGIIYPAEQASIFTIDGGITAGDWPLGPMTVAMSATGTPDDPANATRPNNMALYLSQVLRESRSVDLSYGVMAEAVMRLSAEKDEFPLPIPVIYGAGVSADTFFLKVKRTAPFPVAEPTITPPIMPDPPQRKASKVWYGVLGASGACTVGSVIAGARYGSLHADVRDPSNFNSYKEYEDAVREHNAAAGLSGAFGACAVITGSVATAGIIAKW